MRQTAGDGKIPVARERLQGSKSGGTADSKMTVRPEPKVWGGFFYSREQQTDMEGEKR